MRLLIKQRVFSWSDTYDVYNQYGEARYYVKAELFSFGHQIHVYDKRSGREVGSIHQKLLTILPKFEIVIDGIPSGEIHRDFTFFKPRYRVDFCDWEVEGDMLGWDYRVYQKGQQVLAVTKELFHWGDTYVLEFSNAGDEIPALLLTIAIDAANCGHD